MDLIKIGQFIAEKRKEKKLTQDQLGELMGISGKSVSKWERGLNMPDIEKLESLCNVLDVKVVDVLNGEINSNITENSSNISFFEVLKVYKSKFRKNYLISFSIVIIFIFLIFSILFTLGNYDKNKIYSINSVDSDYSVNGYLVFNQEQNLIIINEISYQGELLGTMDEPQPVNLKIFLKYDDDIIASFKDEQNLNENKYLSEILNDFSITLDENKKNNSNIITSIDDEHKLFLFIEYVDNTDKVDIIKIELNLKEEFSSNKFFY